MGTVLDVSEYINTDLSRTCTKTIEGFPFEINTIVWRSNVSNNSKIYYMTPAGELLEAKPTSYNKNQAGFYHAVFVHSPFFRPGMNFSPDPDNPTLFDLAGQEEQQKVLCALRAAIRAEIDAVFRQFLVLQADKTLDDMEKRGTFPQFRDDEYDQLRKKDFKTVTRELYCVEPRFASLRRVWRFIAVCTEVDDDVKVKYANFKQYGKKGLADIIGNFELYALTWDDVFQMFEARNSFMLNKLHLDYSQLSQELALPRKTPESRAETNEAVQQLCAVDAF